MITWVIADLDFGDLSLRLAVLKAAPVAAAGCLCAAISAVLQTELVLNTARWLQFIDCNQPVFVVELVDCRKVPVLLSINWQVRIGFFDRELGAFALENTLKTPAIESDRSCLVVSFLLLLNCLFLLVYDAS